MCGAIAALLYGEWEQLYDRGVMLFDLLWRIFEQQTMQGDGLRGAFGTL